MFPHGELASRCRAKSLAAAVLGSRVGIPVAPSGGGEGTRGEEAELGWRWRLGFPPPPSDVN